MATKLSSDELYLRFYHPDIKYLSDRTFKELIKEFSKICRALISDEIDEFIEDLDIDYRAKQSLRDRVQKELPNYPSYYVEKLEKGSLEVLVLLPPVALWILSKLFGPSVKDGYKESGLHEDIKQASSTTFNAISKHLVRRPKILLQKITDRLKKRALGNRFNVKRIEIEPDKRNNIATVIVESTDADKHEAYETFISTDEVKKLVADLLEEERAKSKKRSKGNATKGKNKRKKG
ncbi:MAG TPA: hypothetical protein VGM30_13935 [Puia sp.]|jgi:hypothetical protein